MPRSGSTYLCDLLHCHPGIYSCFEVFHRHRVHAREPELLVEHVNRSFGLALRDVSDPALIDWTHRDSDEFLDVLRQLASGRLLSFKVFANQLSYLALRRSILGNQSCAKVLFRRDILSSFVSREKARARDEWEFADTSDLRVSLDAAAFKRFADRAAQWYSEAELFLERSGQPYGVLSYEDLMGLDTARSRLERVLEVAAIAGARVTPLDGLDIDDPVVGRERQDRSANLEDKIDNLEEFSAGLRRLGLQSHLP